MILSRYHDLIVELLARNYSYSRIQYYILNNYNVIRGISIRSIRRY